MSLIKDLELKESVLSREDLIVWPDGSWCHADDLPQMTHLGDDYERLKYDSAEYHAFLEDENNYQ